MLRIAVYTSDIGAEPDGEGLAVPGVAPDQGQLGAYGDAGFGEEAAVGVYLGFRWLVEIDPLEANWTLLIWDLGFVFLVAFFRILEAYGEVDARGLFQSYFHVDGFLWPEEVVRDWEAVD